MLALIKSPLQAVKNATKKVRAAFDYKCRHDYLILDDQDRKIVDTVMRDTMISVAGIVATMDSVRYLHDNNIDGSIIECGVWKGGATKAMMMKLVSLGDTSRHFFLYDTFEGMTAPSEDDVSFRGNEAIAENNGTIEGWCYSPLEYVKKSILSSGYPADKIHFVKGDVRETIPASENDIDNISLLRLDTDWYELTKLEMDSFYPKIVSRGVLIIDDYGFWKGARKAVDEYFQANNMKPFLHRIDYSERMMIKS